MDKIKSIIILGDLEHRLRRRLEYLPSNVKIYGALLIPADALGKKI